MGSRGEPIRLPTDRAAVVFVGSAVRDRLKACASGEEALRMLGTEVLKRIVQIPMPFDRVDFVHVGWLAADAVAVSAVGDPIADSLRVVAPVDGDPQHFSFKLGLAREQDR